MKWDVIRNAVFARKTRSAWGHAVKMYALDIIDKNLSWEYEADAFVRANAAGREKMMLAGAASWRDASYGGSFLIENEKIAFRCCNPSEYEHRKQGARAEQKRNVV